MRPQICLVIPMGEMPNWGGPVDPGWGVTPPVDPGFGRPGGGGPVDPGFGNRPPVDPSWGVQAPPVDPGYGRPNVGAGRPDNTLPGGGARPDNTLPLPPNSTVPPGTIYPPITELHTKTATLAWLPGYGYRWIVLGPQAPVAPGTKPVPPAQPKA